MALREQLSGNELSNVPTAALNTEVNVQLKEQQVEFLASQKHCIHEA